MKSKKSGHQEYLKKKLNEFLENLGFSQKMNQKYEDFLTKGIIVWNFLHLTSQLHCSSLYENNEGAISFLWSWESEEEFKLHESRNIVQLWEMWRSKVWQPGLSCLWIGRQKWIQRKRERRKMHCQKVMYLKVGPAVDEQVGDSCRSGKFANDAWSIQNIEKYLRCTIVVCFFHHFSDKKSCNWPKSSLIIKNIVKTCDSSDWYFTRRKFSKIVQTNCLPKLKWQESYFLQLFCREEIRNNLEMDWNESFWLFKHGQNHTLLHMVTINQEIWKWHWQIIDNDLVSYQIHTFVEDISDSNPQKEHRNSIITWFSWLKKGCSDRSHGHQPKKRKYGNR